MQEHFATSSTSPEGSMTETSNSCYEDTSSEDGGSPSFWLAGVNNNFSKFAKAVGQNLDGFASAVNRGARNLIHELAELENDTMGYYGDYPDGSSPAFGERSLGGQSVSSSSSSKTTASISRSDGDIGPQKVREDRNNIISGSVSMENVLPLPWEICIQQPGAEGESMIMSVEHKEDTILKDKILALSRKHDVFTGPFSENHKVSRSFRLDSARIMLIQRLLAIDPELSQVHSKYISDRRDDELKKTLFWQNYFYHCDKVREERQLEIHEENRLKAHHDDELDAELVGRPPPSCTGFYPKTGKLQDQSLDVKLSQYEEDTLNRIDVYMCDVDEFVMVEKEDGQVG